MTTDPAHIDAVAGAVRIGDPWTALPNSVARAVLDSPDPAVHAAMLDALTRHGVLTEDRFVVGDGVADRRRLATRWEVAP